MLMSKKKEISRRAFLTNVAAGGAACAIVPRHVLGRGFTPPSDTLNVAGVGVGGMGRNNLINLASQNIVALCDVDWGYADKRFDRLDIEIERLKKRIELPAPPPPGEPPVEFDPVRVQARLDGMMKLKTEHLPKAKRYQDYRQMLERQKDIDAVMVATPDHMHASIALAAMDLGKHVYVQKPLCWSVEEARKLSRRAREVKVATQMGNQGHSSDDGRTAVEYVWSGAIGDVSEVHIWTNRPLGYWPQGVPRPEPLKEGPEPLKWSGRDVNTRLAAALCGDYPIPGGLAWDLFLGTASNNVDYHPIYHPFNWRGWTDWGVGAIGDMGAHLIDHSMWALNLGLPTSVETVSTPFNGASYPHATLTFYEFPARGAMPPVKLTWYDGGLAQQAGRARRRRVEKRRRRAAHRQQGQAPSRYLRLQAPALAQVAPRFLRQAPAEATSHRRRSPRNELGGCRQGKSGSLLSVRVRRPSHRGYAPRHRGAAHRKEDLLRRRQHAHHQRVAGQRLFAA
jgi:predicted dehydrogenase